jgi:hypothetical protein
VLIGGDFNTNGFDYSREAAETQYEKQRRDGIIADATENEPLFCAIERAGYTYRACNGERTETRRRPTGDGQLRLHLDWMVSKNAWCVRHGCVSTVLSEEPFDQLSDHNAIWADFRL